MESHVFQSMSWKNTYLEYDVNCFLNHGANRPLFSFEIRSCPSSAFFHRADAEKPSIPPLPIPWPAAVGETRAEQAAGPDALFQVFSGKPFFGGLEWWVGALTPWSLPGWMQALKFHRGISCLPCTESTCWKMVTK